ncbi:MAG: hypothetical protein IVW56_07965 [Candidatus Binataceae bacterium]|nr:hypothetical protein [Candidatus Binataceae bacterium]
MLKFLKFAELNQIDLIPQAVIKKPISFFEKQGIGFVHDNDTLDVFDGAAFLLDDLRFALMHHAGYPADTTTVYLPRDFGEDVEKITASIRVILSALQLSAESLVWERKDTPEL